MPSLVPFNLNDIYYNNIDYIDSQRKLLAYTNEILLILNQRITTFKNKPDMYLLSLGSVSLRLIFKIELQNLENSKKEKSSRYTQIKNMLEGNEPLSIFKGIDKEEEKEKAKIKTITKFHLRKYENELKT